MKNYSALKSVAEKIKEGSYDSAVEELRPLLAENQEDSRIRLYDLISTGLSASPVTGEELTKTWEQIEPLLEATPQYDFLEEARQLLSIYANAVYTRCNEWQMLEYALLQKDVSFEKKELVLKEFQKILLKADIEYKAVLNVFYGYTALSTKIAQMNAPVDFLTGALKTMTDAAKLQGEIGLEEAYDPLNLALYACSLKLPKDLEEVWEMRRQLLDLCLHGEIALARWEEFAPYANPDKKKELEKEVNKLLRREKLKFWKRLGKAKKNN